MRWVMAWYFRRKSFSEPVDSVESLLAPPAWGPSSSAHSPLFSSVKNEYNNYVQTSTELLSCAYITDDVNINEKHVFI